MELHSLSKLTTWKSIVEVIHLPAFIIDFEFKIKVGNGVFFDFSGFQLDDFGGGSVYQQLAPVYESQYAKIDVEVFCSGRPFSLEGTMFCKDGRIVQVKYQKSLIKDEYGSGVGLLNILVDQSVSQGTQEQIAELEAEKKAFSEGCPSIVTLFNEKKELLWVSKENPLVSEKDLGRKIEEICCPVMEECQVPSILTDALNGKQQMAVQQTRLGNKELYLEVYGMPILDSKEKRAFLFCNDITEKFNLEKQLRHSQKMEAIGTLSGGIAHDFNNVLTPIMGYSEILRLKILELELEDSELGGYLSEILRASRRAKGLVEQILTFSRSSEHKESLQFLHPIIKEVLKLLKATLPASIKIVEEIDENCGRVKIDPVLIHQVIINLCTNSSYAMEGEQGTINIKLLPAERLADNRPWLKLIVEDNGGGICPDVLDRIFEPYFTTKEKGVGTGMGLAMVHGIIKRQGGEIEVDSSLGKGTCVTVYLPVVEENTTTVQQIIKGENYRNGKGAKILLVDDDPQVVKVTADILRNLGYVVTGVTSPVEAVSTLQKTEPGTFALLITDMTMPDLNGMELALKARKVDLTLPVILISGYSEQLPQDTMDEAGIVAYCHKPISLRELGRVVHHAITTAKRS